MPRPLMQANTAKRLHWRVEVHSLRTQGPKTAIAAAHTRKSSSCGCPGGSLAAECGKRDAEATLAGFCLPLFGAL